MGTELINYAHGFAKIEKIFSKGFDEKNIEETRDKGKSKRLLSNFSEYQSKSYLNVLESVKTIEDFVIFRWRAQNI